MTKINDLVKLAHENAVNKGFWDKPRETGTLIALIHSEVAEALEAEDCENFCEELADICIRIFDLCGGMGIDLTRELSFVTQAWNKDNEYVIDFNLGSLGELENSLTKISMDLDDNKQACEVNKGLSHALEHDRKGKKSEFEIVIACTFFMTLVWAARKGYMIEDAILAKMEKNKERPRLHGKAY